jgi:hypothetical protein
MINYIKKLEIKKDQINLINIENITIGELIIEGVCYKKEDYYVITDKNFYIKNVDFFIKLKNSQQCLNAIISFDDKIIKDRAMLAKLIDIISNDKDLNVLVGLLNYSFAFQKKYGNTLINPHETSIKYQIIIDSKDPIVYLRSARYIFGKRWLENNYVYDHNDRKKIEEIILDNINKYKETNVYDKNRYEEKTAYLQLLGYYVNNFINSRWKEFEEKILYNNDYLFINYIRKFFKNRDENIENILLKLNMAYLFFYYFKNILKQKLSGENHPNYGKKFSIERRINMSIVRRKELNPNYGKKLSDEQKNKISNTMLSFNKDKRELINDKIKETLKLKIKNCKKVFQYDLNNNFIKEYNSISEASKILNISRSSIQRCCDGKYKTTKEYIWKYV